MVEVPAAALPRRLLFRLLAALAASHLGPILPPERDTLYAVRGANERALAES